MTLPVALACPSWCPALSGACCKCMPLHVLRRAVMALSMTPRLPAHGAVIGSKLACTRFGHTAAPAT